MNYDSIKLEKSMYNHKNKNFTSVLEELDPSENYRGTTLEGLDAFERQLKRFDIKVKGPYSDYVQKFFDAESNEILLNEYIKRSIETSENNNILDDIIATKTKIDGLSYCSFDISEENEEKNKAEKVKEGQNIPEFDLKLNDRKIMLEKFAFCFNLTEEAARSQKINIFSTAISQMTKTLRNKLLENAVNVIINGNDENDVKKAPIINIAKNKITYSDILDMYAHFEELKMDRILVSPAIQREILELDELKKSIIAQNLSETEGITTIFGAKLIVSNAIPENMIIGLNKNSAIEQVYSQELEVQHDNDIIKQIKSVTVTTTTAFVKLSKHGAVVLQKK